MPKKKQLNQILKKAWDLRVEGKYLESRKLLQTAEQICTPENYLALGRIYHIIMNIESDKERYEKALENSDKSVQCYIKSKVSDRIAHALRHNADILRNLNKVEQSEATYRQALELYNNAKDTHPGDLANAYQGLALLMKKMNKIEEAINLWKKIEGLYSGAKYQYGITYSRQKIEQLVKEK